MLPNVFACGWCFGMCAAALIDGRYMVALNCALFGLISGWLCVVISKLSKEGR